MKKIKYLIFILLLVCVTPIYASPHVFTDESWIAAYHFKKFLTPEERYLPFIDVREHNYRFTSPGACVRTILADFIILQQMPLFEALMKQYDSSMDFKTLIVTVFNNMATRKDFENKITELTIYTIFQEEILTAYNHINIVYPHNFYYRFYHLVVSEYESIAVCPLYQLKKSKYSDKIQAMIYKYVEGTLDSLNIEELENEISDSVLATKRINAMMPIHAEEYIGYYTSPFVSAEITVMDEDMKNAYPGQIKSSYGIDLLILMVDKPYIEQIVDFIRPFDMEILYNIKNLFKDRFGEVDTDIITQTNLRDYLLLINPYFQINQKIGGDNK